MTVETQFFQNEDSPVAGPPREIRGYGEQPPIIEWEDNAKVALNIVINYEEGSEKTFAMGDSVNDGLYEMPFEVEGQRDLAVESMYEYGSRGRYLVPDAHIRRGRNPDHLVRHRDCARAQSGSCRQARQARR